MLGKVFKALRTDNESEYITKLGGVLGWMLYSSMKCSAFMMAVSSAWKIVVEWCSELYKKIDEIAITL